MAPPYYFVSKVLNQRDYLLAHKACPRSHIEDPRLLVLHPLLHSTSCYHRPLISFGT